MSSAPRSTSPQSRSDLTRKQCPDGLPPGVGSALEQVGSNNSTGPSDDDGSGSDPTGYSSLTFLGTDSDNPAIQQLHTELERKHEKLGPGDDESGSHLASDVPKHSFSRWNENRWFARARDVDRYFVYAYESNSFVTAMVTVCDEPESDVDADDGVREHAEGLYNSLFATALRDGLRAVNGFDGHARLSVIAPKNGQRGERSTSHRHLFLWIPVSDASDVARSLRNEFKSLILDWDIHVSAWHQDTREIQYRVPLDERDATYGNGTRLSGEVGQNLPLVKYSLTDPRECSVEIQDWIARIWFGDRLNRDTSLTRVRPEGRFLELAKWGRER